MKAQRIHFPEPGRADFEQYDAESVERPDLVAGPTLFSLISVGTELNLYNGAYAAEGRSFGQFPVQPGYAAVFRVEITGPEVTRFKPGDLAFTMGPHVSWQQREEKETLPVPDGLDAKSALFARMMNITMSALTLTTARPPEGVLVTGLGLVGLLGAMMFQSCGYRVAGVDPNEARGAFAAARGLRIVSRNCEAAVSELGARPALGLECSGHEAAVLDNCRSVAAGGEVICVGVPLARKTDLYALPILNAVFRSNIALRGGSEWQVPRHPQPYRHNSVFGNLATALEWIAQGRVKVDDLYEIRRPDEASALYPAFASGQVMAHSVVLDWAHV